MAVRGGLQRSPLHTIHTICNMYTRFKFIMQLVTQARSGHHDSGRWLNFPDQNTHTSTHKEKLQRLALHKNSTMLILGYLKRILSIKMIWRKSTRMCMGFLAQKVSSCYKCFVTVALHLLYFPRCTINQMIANTAGRNSLHRSNKTAIPYEWHHMRSLCQLPHAMVLQASCPKSP